MSKDYTNYSGQPDNFDNKKTSRKKNKGVIEMVNDLADKAVDFASDKIDKAQDILEDFFE
jgi:hypothetical protein